MCARYAAEIKNTRRKIELSVILVHFFDDFMAKVHASAPLLISKYSTFYPSCTIVSRSYVIGLCDRGRCPLYICVCVCV